MKRQLVVWGSLCLVLSAGCGIDLMPLGFQAPTTATIGQDITSQVSAFVYNIGGAPVEAEACTGIFWVNFLISEDEEIGLDDTIINSVDFVDFPLDAREARALLFEDEYERLEIPEGTPLGQVYIGTYVDARGYCMELDEQNNAAALAIEILPAQ